jgi:hypothetical protein
MPAACRARASGERPRLLASFRSTRCLAVSISCSVLDAVAPQLGGEGALRQPAAVVPGLDPGPGERGVVDQPGIGEAVQDGFGGLVGDAAAMHRLG